MKRTFQRKNLREDSSAERIRGAVLFLCILFLAALIIAVMYSEITPGLLVCLIGGILAMLFSIYLKKKKQESAKRDKNQDSPF